MKFGQQLVMLFVGNSEKEVLELSQIYFNISCSFYVVLAVLFIIRYTLQGLGQSIVPTIAGVSELVMRTLAALFLATSFGYAGACFASPLAWIGSCVVLIFSYVKAVKMLKKREKLEQQKNQV